MSLSIRAAASKSPRRIALIAGNKQYTYQEIAALAAKKANALPSPRKRKRGAGHETGAIVGRNDLATLIGLCAHFERRVPVMLLHPRWTKRERSEAARELPVPRFGRGNERPAAVVFTSGTTNRPKGVILSGRAFLAGAAASEANLGWEEDDRWLLNMPVAHIGGLSIVTRCLIARRTVVLQSRFDPAALARIVERRRVTLLSLVPAMLRRLLREVPSWTPPRHLRAVLMGGGPFPRDLHGEAIDRGVPVLPTYGMTETCSQAATARYGEPLFVESGAAPLDTVEMRTTGGHVEVRGPVLMSGYLERGERRVPFTEDGWFRTNDLGRIDSTGRLHILGRREELVITGGENVSTAEVEEILLRLSGVREVCVFGAPDRERGETVCAAVVARTGRSVDLDGAKPLIEECLASYKRPRRYLLLPSIPRLPSGAPDREALVDMIGNE